MPEKANVFGWLSLGWVNVQNGGTTDEVQLISTDEPLKTDCICEEACVTRLTVRRKTEIRQRNRETEAISQVKASSCQIFFVNS